MLPFQCPLLDRSRCDGAALRRVSSALEARRHFGPLGPCVTLGYTSNTKKERGKRPASCTEVVTGRYTIGGNPVRAGTLNARNVTAHSGCTPRAPGGCPRTHGQNPLGERRGTGAADDAPPTSRLSLVFQPTYPERLASSYLCVTGRVARGSRNEPETEVAPRETSAPVEPVPGSH